MVCAWSAQRAPGGCFTCLKDITCFTSNLKTHCHRFLLAKVFLSILPAFLYYSISRTETIALVSYFRSKDIISTHPLLELLPKHVLDHDRSHAGASMNGCIIEVRSPNQTRIRPRCLFVFHFENLLNKLKKSSYTNMHVQNTFAVHSASLRLYRATDATNTVLHSPPNRPCPNPDPDRATKYAYPCGTPFPA